MRAGKPDRFGTPKIIYLLYTTETLLLSERLSPLEWGLASVDPVKEWLHSLRSTDRELLLKISADLEALRRGGPGMDHRPMVDSLTGDAAKSIKLKELRTEGTIRIAF